MSNIERICKIVSGDALLVTFASWTMLAILCAMRLAAIAIYGRLRRRMTSMPELRHLIPLVFPTLIIILSAAAGVAYLLYGDWRRGAYWLLAAGLGACVTW